MTNSLRGKQFGQLTVTEYVGNSRYLAVCSCGKEKVYYATNLKNGRTKSCGCARRELLHHAAFKHGYAETPTYYAYYRYRHGGYANFQEWLNDVGPQPRPKARIDRKDRNKGYVKGNLRWSMRKVPTVRSMLIGGKLINELTSRSQAAVLARQKKGWCLDCALYKNECVHIKEKAKCSG